MSKSYDTQSGKRPLSPQEQRCHDALQQNSEGVKSYDLRLMTRCSYPASVIQRIKKKGYSVVCVMEQDGLNTDDAPTSIGRYFLEEVDNDRP